MADKAHIYPHEHDSGAARNAAMKAANIDPAGLDPEMAQTLGQEAARRVGAAGVTVKPVNPLAGVSSVVSKISAYLQGKKGK